MSVEKPKPSGKAKQRAPLPGADPSPSSDQLQRRVRSELEKLESRLNRVTDSARVRITLLENSRDVLSLELEGARDLIQTLMQRVLDHEARIQVLEGQ